MNRQAEGYLMVNVRYANGAAPVVDATVRVTHENGDLIGEYKTGIDGKIERMTLPSGEEYSVSVSSEGFIGADNMNVPIMPGVLSIQNTKLFPLYNYPVEAI